MRSKKGNLIDGVYFDALNEAHGISVRHQQGSQITPNPNTIF